MKSRKNSFYRNTVAQTGGRILYLLTRVGLPPLILKFVSLEEYGLWSTCFLLISYVGMGAFGVSNVYIRYVAEYVANQQIDLINGLVSTGLLLTSMFSLCALGGVWIAMPLILNGFNVAPQLHETAQVLIMGTLATMMLDFTLGAFAFVLHGLQRIEQQTLVWIFSFMLETGIMVTLLLSGYGMNSLLLAFFARYIFSTIIYVFLCYRALPGLQIGIRLVNRNFFKQFLHYGGILQISGLLSVFLYSIERLMAGHLTGLTAVAVLDLGQKFPLMASQVFSSMNASFLPAITEAHSLGKHQDIKRLYANGLRYLNLLNGLAMGFVAPFAGWLLAVWIGRMDGLEDSLAIMICACAGYQLNCLTGPLSAYYQGTNHPARSLGYLLWQILVLIACSLAAWRYFGFDVVIIAEIAMTARVVSALVYLFQGNYELGLEHRRLIGFILLPGALPYLWGYGIMAAIQPWLTEVQHQRWLLLAVLAFIGLIYTVLAFSTFYAFLCDSDEQSQIRNKLKIKSVP